MRQKQAHRQKVSDKTEKTDTGRGIQKETQRQTRDRQTDRQAKWIVQIRLILKQCFVKNLLYTISQDMFGV